MPDDKTTLAFDEFGSWEDQQERHYEFTDGKPTLLPVSSQLRSLLISYLVASLKHFVEGTDLKVLTRPRLTISEVEEVRYPDIVVDGGPFVAEAREPLRPLLVIDVDRVRDWSALADVRYLTIPAAASPSEVSRFLTKILAVVRP